MWRWNFYAILQQHFNNAAREPQVGHISQVSILFFAYDTLPMPVCLFFLSTVIQNYNINLSIVDVSFNRRSLSHFATGVAENRAENISSNATIVFICQTAMSITAWLIISGPTVDLCLLISSLNAYFHQCFQLLLLSSPNCRRLLLRSTSRSFFTHLIYFIY